MGRKSPPPPPPNVLDTALQYVETAKTDPQVLGGLVAIAVVAITLLWWIFRKISPKTIRATCELGVSGRGQGDGFRHSPISPQKGHSSSHIDRIHRASSSNSFIPALADKPTGTVTLEQTGGYCTIKYRLSGITPGLHAFHIHETSDFSNGCQSAGAIYNPFNRKHGGPDDDERMVGDLGNVKADATGVAQGSIVSDRVKLSGPYTVVGRSFMLHADPDDLGNGDNSEPGGDGKKPVNGKCSLVTGNCGVRIACGAIKLAAPA